jgi:hypothetical protein
MPCSITAAATSRSTPPGTGTSRATGRFASSAYPPPSTMAQATRSPTDRSATSAPTSATVPAPSEPATNGSDFG